MIVATELLEAIDKALTEDQCAQWRQNLKWLLPKMDDAYRGKEKPFRNHQGASSIGAECSRQLQLRWRWVKQSHFPARVLRLFNRGHLEEARFLAMLLCVPGLELWFETDKGGQFKFDYFGGHYGSALDGIARNVPGIPNGEACYTEFKTSNTKGFKITKEKGFREEHFDHYVQMQECMMAYELKWGLYVVVCKETDEIHAELIEYNKTVALRFKERANNIIFQTEAMPRISNKITFFKCRFCDEKDVCFGKEKPAINCRTCCHWSPEPSGGYSCARNNDEIFRDAVYSGCSEHVYDPTLLANYEYLGGNAEANYTILRHTKSKEEFKQGPNHLSSKDFKCS